jgi:hypothetical protein
MSQVFGVERRLGRLGNISRGEIFYVEKYGRYPVRIIPRVEGRIYP